jgi:hypothetical protein
MNSNKPKDFDTSTAWHDYTVAETIARHFWVGETTGYQAVANAWAQIAQGKIDEMGLGLGFTEGVGFLHALNTFGKNLHINGYGHKTNGGRQSYVDYRLLEQYRSETNKNFVENGYAVSLGGAPADAISDYKSKYAKDMLSADRSVKSYLSSTQEYLVSESIVSILCGDFMDSLADSLDATYGLDFVQGFTWPSENHWKMSAPWCNGQVTSPSTIVVMVAIEDHHPVSGVLQVVAGSHALDLDQNIMKDISTPEKYNDYIQYCHKLANADVCKIYQHMPMTGDIIAWQGKSLYSDAIPNSKTPLTRNSLIGVFNKVNVEDSKDSLIPIPNRNRLFLIK